MRKRILLMGLSFLVAAALVLTSCGPAVEEEAVEEEAVEEEAVEEEAAEEEAVEEEVAGAPNYGGIITVYDLHSHVCLSDPPNPDVATGHFVSTQWLKAWQETPFQGDFIKYGARGTGEYDFQLQGGVPEEYLRGTILDSWEVHADKLVWHIKTDPPVYWHDNPYLGFDFEARPITAADVLADLTYFSKTSKGGPRFDELAITDMYLEGDSVVMEWDQFNVNWVFLIGTEDRALITPPEMELDGRMGKWDCQVGSGPWMFKEYVVGSHMELVRNPNFWETETIDGVEYEIPFMDGIIMMIIPDAATYTAALRTGALDFVWKLGYVYWDEVKQFAPEIQSMETPAASGTTLRCNWKSPPLDNVNIRRALSIGTDRMAFAKIEGTEHLTPHFYPISPLYTSVYVPLEELPANIQELYDYDPEKAKQMIIDEGYPDGLSIRLQSEPAAFNIEKCSLIKDQWALLNVDVTIETFESITWRQNMYDLLHDFSISQGGSGQELYNQLMVHTTTHWTNWSGIADPVYDEMVHDMALILDTDERMAKCTEAYLYMAERVPAIDLNQTLAGHFWWPWIKNYFGERNIAENVWHPILAHAWLDEDMKKDMGY